MTPISHILCDFSGTLLFSDLRTQQIHGKEQFNIDLVEFFSGLGLPVTVISSAPLKRIKEYQEQLVPPCVELVSFPEIGLSKSEPQDYLTFCARNNLDLSTTLLIDDSSHKIDAAEKAGLNTIQFQGTEACISEFKERFSATASV